MSHFSPDGIVIGPHTGIDEFDTCWCGTVDLNDPDTYKADIWDSLDTVYKLRRQVWIEIGESFVYMDYLEHDPKWPDAYDKQRARVVVYAKTFAREFHNRGKDDAENRAWWKKFRYMFQDEVENQC